MGAPDDDAAVWRGDRLVVATTDTMVEEIDFRLSWPGFDYRLLGRRLMSINLSDLAAMGAEPRYALVSLALRGTMGAGDVHRIYRGIAEQAHQYGVALAGGDLSGTLGPLTLTATLVGRLPGGAVFLRRQGARPGWQIAVTGAIGAAAGGLRLLESGEPATSRRDRALVRAQLDPVPQILAGQLLVRAGVRVGGDISDGLYREVERLTEGGGLGATIQIDALPLAGGVDWMTALRDSEDFELICAGPASVVDSAGLQLKKHGLALTAIGRIDREAGVRLRHGGQPVTLEAAGYEHFR